VRWSQSTRNATSPAYSSVTIINGAWRWGSCHRGRLQPTGTYFPETWIAKSEVRWPITLPCVTPVKSYSEYRRILYDSCALLLTAKHRLGRSLFLLQNRFLASYCQYWTNLDTILHTPIVVRSTLWADLDGDRHVGSSRPNQNDYVFCNTCNAP